jgi:tricorn protease-like protein
MLAQRSSVRSLIVWMALLLSLSIISVSCQNLTAVPRKEAHGSIYYESMNNIWKLEVPGGSPIRLAENVIDSPLELSPNQKWIVYVKYKLQGNQTLASIWIVSTAGEKIIEVSKEVSLAEYSWMADNSLLITEYPDFHVDPKSGQAMGGQGSTYLFNPETGERRPASSLTLTTDQSHCQTFVAPNQPHNVAERCDNGPDNSFLRVIQIDNTQTITLAMPYKAGGIAWSIDGNKLAFSSRDGTGDSQLFVWNRNDSNTKRITLGEVDFIAPSWSPDGAWVAFQSGGNDLCVVQTNTGAVKCFQGYVSALGVPSAWSPDSRSIVLASNRISGLALGEPSSDWDLFAIDIPGGKVTRITHDAQTESRPIWGQ